MGFITTFIIAKGTDGVKHIHVELNFFRLAHSVPARLKDRQSQGERKRVKGIRVKEQAK